MNQNMTVLVTGASGMIGSCVAEGLLKAGHSVIGVDRAAGRLSSDGYEHIVADLGNQDELEEIFRSHSIDRVIHLAALAHTDGEKDLSYERYYHVNVECAEHVFDLAKKYQAKVLFISTVDVLGFAEGTVSGSTKPRPVTSYGVTKALAERALKKTFKGYADSYSIYRLSPVYTKEIKRDIQKRYYLKYPHLAYRIGKGQQYEVLDISKAVDELVMWASSVPKNQIRIIKDASRLSTAEMIQEEKKAGRATIVVWVPVWAARLAYRFFKMLLGENPSTYLLYKAVFPYNSVE